MKKVVLSAALALAVAGSCAFYPKSDGPAGYMMVTSHLEFGAKSNVLSTLAPDGQRQKTTVVSENRKTNQEDLEKATLLKLNQLRQAGWHVVSMTTTVEARSTAGQSDGIQTTYLLEK